MSLLAARGAHVLRPRVPLMLRPVLIDPLTESITVRLPRPTAANPSVGWTDRERLTVRIVVMLDGETHHCIGSATGGPRVDQLGRALDQYVLRYGLTYGFFGREDRARRLGELGRRMTAHVEFYSRSGLVIPELLFEGMELMAPELEVHHSVAFDATSEATETGGDGTVSLSHTSTGSNRGVFGGHSVNGAGDISTTSITYNGVGMTKSWDNQDFAIIGLENAGFYMAAQATGAQTVTAITPSSPITDQHLGVISMTGVDQTDVIITREDGVASGLTSPATFTPTSTIDAAGMFCDNTSIYTNGFISVGANQTERISQIGAAIYQRGSTQAGSDGGTMSWDISGSSFLQWTCCAVCFKSTGGSAAPTVNVGAGSWTTTTPSRVVGTLLTPVTP